MLSHYFGCPTVVGAVAAVAVVVLPVTSKIDFYSIVHTQQPSKFYFWLCVLCMSACEREKESARRRERERKRVFKREREKEKEYLRERE